MAEVGKWLLLALALVAWAKTYGYLRDRHGTDDNNWLEGAGAFWIASLVWPFVGVLLLVRWIKRRLSLARQPVQAQTAPPPSA